MITPEEELAAVERTKGLVSQLINVSREHGYFTAMLERDHRAGTKAKRDRAEGRILALRAELEAALT
jgi:hypothetical protein